MSGRPEVVNQALKGAFKTMLLCVVLSGIFFTNSAGNAQVLYGSITGTVTDKTGAVIPGAAITVTNQGTGDIRNVTADRSGGFSLLDVLPGAYTVSVPAKGNFGGFSEKDIQIEVNRQVRVEIALQPAGITAQVTVTEAPPALQTETGEVNGEISQTELTQLPITSSQGRNFQSLYTLIPGAAAVSERNSIGGNPFRSLSVNVNGISYNGNNTRLDGAINSYGWLPYLVAYVPPADAIENVSFTTNSFNAEQGLAGGATVKVTTKSGTSSFHGGAWEYYQDAAINAAPYRNPHTQALPKNVYQEHGFNIGGPVYIPHLLTGQKKVFFFTNFDRITRRQAISGYSTVPDTNLIAGNFAEVANGAGNKSTILYDPAPTVPSAQWISTIDPTKCPTLTYVNGYLSYPCRPSFINEYGQTGASYNSIPKSRISSAAAALYSALQPISAKVGTSGEPTADLTQVLANDIFSSATFAYTRKASDTKITFVPNENTQIFGKYSISPYSAVDPQPLGAAGGYTYDGGQPGAAAGRAQSVGLGASHVFSANLVVDADFGFTRQRTGAQSTLDLQPANQNYGTNVLGIPGTNTPTGDPNYYGQPGFSFTGFDDLGNTNTANPFLFRDNQFTGDVNLSWVKSKHSTKFGFTYFHFDLNHFQPQGTNNFTNPRGGFFFEGGLTCGATTCANPTGYNAVADFLLGLPNNGSSAAVGKSQQVSDPNSLRWSTFAVYGQDQWAVTSKFTVDYGVRWELYPAPYRDHGGVSVLIPGLPQNANVEIGGVNGNPKNAGIDAGHGFFAPRLGLNYRLTPKTDIRGGGGITTEPESYRYLRDEFPEEVATSYSGTGTGTVPVDPANNNAPITLSSGIPLQTFPNTSLGFVSLPVSASTTTVAQRFRRGYIESWNLFLQRDLGHDWVANAGYVGNHAVRLQTEISLNAAPLPSAGTPCMANGQYNSSTGLSGPCRPQANELINEEHCTAASVGGLTCYNIGGIEETIPSFGSTYHALQSQLTHDAKNLTLGVVYTYSHAIDYNDNGAGSGQENLHYNYPAYFRLNKGTAGFDQKHNLQVYSVYSLPFGYGQQFLNHGLIGQIMGGFKVNGQFSHFSGFPFSVSASSNTLGSAAPGISTTFAQLVAPYQQLGGHAQGSNGLGKAWFNAASFTNPTEPTISLAGNPTSASPVFPNTGRNSFRGPGVSIFNASILRSVRIYHEDELQFRCEAFNLFNHPWLNNPNATVNGGTFGYITSYGPANSPTQGARSLQLSARVSF